MEDNNMVFVEGTEMPEVETSTTIAEMVEDANDVEFHPITVLVPDDTEVVSMTVVRNKVNEDLGRHNAIVTTVFPGDIALHDTTTGFSYRVKDDGRICLVLDNEENYDEFELSDEDGIKEILEEILTF